MAGMELATGIDSLRDWISSIPTCHAIHGRVPARLSVDGEDRRDLDARARPPREFEEKHTYSNPAPLLNLITLNFGYTMRIM
ncbi:MAG: hypothetical protein U1F34_04800 [Gammaproteobacteria bacterium]